MHSLLFAFLDELLFVFHSELVILKELKIQTFDRDSWIITATGCVLFTYSAEYFAELTPCIGGGFA